MLNFSFRRFHGVSGMSAAVAATMLEDATFVRQILSLSRSRLSENYHIATGALTKAGINYRKGG